MADFNDNQASGLQHLNPMRSTFIHGPSSIKQTNYGKHHLQESQENHAEREKYCQLGIARSVQGIHAPIRLLTERRSAQKIGRLPFLASSNLMLDVLTGRDELILPEDVLNNPTEFVEVDLPAHMTVERSLNIL